MFSNVYIQIDQKEKLVTDNFQYNAEKHELSFHQIVPMQTSWRTVSNVECEIKEGLLMIYVYARTIGEEDSNER